MNAVALTGAHRDVIGNLHAQRAQSLDEQGCGGLAIHIEIAPNADLFLSVDGGADEIHGLIQPWKRPGGCFAGVKEGAG